MSMGLFGELLSSSVRADFSKNMPQGQVEKSKRAFASALRLKKRERARTKRLQTDDSVKGTLLHRADVSRGSSTERVMLREHLRPSLPGRPSCKAVMLRSAA